MYSSNQSMIGSLIGGRYEIEAILGEGGYGVVYRARQISTGQAVAVKLLLPEKMQVAEASVEIARFEREMRTIAQLKHPNIVRLIDTGRLDNGALYTVLEYIEGQTLSDLLMREGSMHPREARYLMMQVLDAVSCAHERGIIHRDLKPANIMVASTGARRNALVLDFGIAAIASDHQGQDYVQLTGVGHINGTPAYMAPEQFGTHPVTPQADIYAWGLVLLECLIGARAVQGNSLGEIVLQHMSADPIPVPQLYHQHPFGYVLYRATAKNLNERYATARQALADLERCDVSDLPRLQSHAAPMPPMQTGQGHYGGNTGQFADFRAQPPPGFGSVAHPMQTPSGNWTVASASHSAAWPPQSSGGGSAVHSGVMQGHPPRSGMQSAPHSGVLGPHSGMHSAPHSGVQQPQAWGMLSGSQSAVHNAPYSSVYGAAPHSSASTVLPDPSSLPRTRRRGPMLLIVVLLVGLVAVGATLAVVLLGNKTDEPTGEADADEPPTSGQPDEAGNAVAGNAGAATRPVASDDEEDEAQPPTPPAEPEVPWALVEVPPGEVTLGVSEAELEDLQARFPDNAFDLSYDTAVQPPRDYSRPALDVMANEVSIADWQHVAPTPTIDSACADSVEVATDADPATPIVGVGAAEAEAFCAAIDMRLPTADEWEAIARGDSGREFGFEGALTAARAEELSSDSLAGRAWNQVGGVAALSGGVREWVRCTRSEHGAYCIDGFAHRGGSWTSGAFWMHAAVTGLMSGESACHRAPDIGFRCVR